MRDGVCPRIEAYPKVILMEPPHIILLATNSEGTNCPRSSLEIAPGLVEVLGSDSPRLFRYELACKSRTVYVMSSENRRHDLTTALNEG